MKLKTAPARVKATGDGAAGVGAGEFEAIVSVFDNVDSWGDVVMPGAFTDSIAEWKSGADTLPVLWSHRMDDPMYNIGEVLDIAELAPGADMPDWVDPWVKEHGGLWVKARVDTGADASPIAVQALRLLKARRVTQFSYAYDEIDAGPVTLDGVDAWALRKLKLYEVSPTQIGANELTELIGAKSRLPVRKGALSTAELEACRGALDTIAEVLTAADVTDDEEPDDDQAAEDTATDDDTADEAAGSLDETTKQRRALASQTAALRLKVGRALSAKNEDRIKQAVALLQETLASVASDEGSDKAKREEPDGAKREEPRHDAASIRSLIDLRLFEAEIAE